VAKLEGRLAAEQERNRQLLQAKEDAANSSEAALEALRLDVETLTSTKEDLHAQLLDKEEKLVEAQKEASQLSDVLERYRADHIRSTETLRTDILELRGQCNLGAPPTSFPRCTVEAFYEWVSACFDLIAMNTKIFRELGAVVGVRTLAYSVCSLVPADRPSSEKTISKCRCLNLLTSIGGTRSKVEGGDRHDLEPKGAREDTRHKIYTGSGSQSSCPTSCLE
jgi:hypothetical protein